MIDKVVPNGVEIIALLPNPEERDKSVERVVIRNQNKDAVWLDGWKLTDRAVNVYVLADTAYNLESSVVRDTSEIVPNHPGIGPTTRTSRPLPPAYRIVPCETPLRSPCRGA